VAHNWRGRDVQVTATAFAALFSVVGLALYGLPLYYDSMVREFGWSRTMVTSGNALSKLVVGPAFGFAAGWIVDRFGPRRLMLAGILMAGGALVGLGTTAAVAAFYFFYFFNALGYVCGGPLPNQVLLSRWFRESRGKAMGVAYLGIGVGGALVPLLSAWLTSRFGWRLSLQLVGVLIVLIAFPLAFFVDDGVPQASAAPREPSADSRQVLGSPAFYLLALGSMCSIAAVGGTNQHLKLFLSLDRGYSQRDASAIISLVLAVSIAGRLLMGWLADRIPVKHVMLIIYTLVAGSVPLLLVAGTSRAALYAFAIAFGLGLGGEYMIIPLMAGQLFGIEVLGRVMGIVLTADGVAEATAPMLVGYLRDHSGSYATGFITLVATAIVGALAIALLPQRRAPLCESSPARSSSAVRAGISSP
jgi:sugar phosphate permease